MSEVIESAQKNQKKMGRLKRIQKPLAQQKIFVKKLQKRSCLAKKDISYFFVAAEIPYKQYIIASSAWIIYQEVHQSRVLISFTHLG